MQRVMILGSPGSGKSTLAIELGRRTGLPVVHQDAMYLKAGWVERPKHEMRPMVASAAAGARWIIDGNDSSTYALRTARADLILFLDLPMPTCMRRVLARTWRHRGEVRAGLPAGCPERFNLPFLWYVAGYPQHSRKKALRLLGEVGDRIEQRTLRSQEQIDAWLAEVSPVSDPVSAEDKGC